MLAVADPDLDNGPRSTKSGTERMCAVSRRVADIGELIRFVVSPDGEVIADLKRKLPGRGLWISASRDAVTEAVRRGVFARGFKRKIQASASLPDDTEAAMVRGAVEALAMTAKAGQVVSGFGKVEDALSQHQAIALIHASDGAPDGIRKLDARVDAVARQGGADEGRAAALPIVTVLSSEQLDLALGRSNVIHAALLAGSAGNTFLSRCQILVRYRMADDTIGRRSGRKNADVA